MNVRFLFSLRIWAAALICVGCVGGHGAPPEARPVYQHHSIGAAQFLKSQDGSRFREVWVHPTSQVLRKQVIDSLSQIPLKNGVANAGVKEARAHFAALLGDVVEYETWMDVRGPEGKAEWLLAIQVPPGRRHAWTNQLLQVLEPLQFSKPAAGRFGKVSGFEVHNAIQMVRAAQVGEWTLLSLSPGPAGYWDEVVQRLQRDRAPAPALQDAWLQVDANLARLRRTFTLLPEFADSQLHLTWGGKGEYVRTQAKLKFEKPLGYQPEEWNLPLGLISEPLVSFTAARGVGPLLARNKEVGEMGLVKDVPSQVSGWALGKGPFFTYAAFPLNGTSNFLAANLNKLPMVMTNHGRAVGQLAWVTNRAQAIWKGLPVLTPFLAPFKDVNQEFLLTGMIPPPIAKDPAPDALLKQIQNRPNLAYYDWEITEERLATWRRVYLVGLMSFGRQAPLTNAPSNLFLNEFSKGQRLGNAVTEVTVTGADELSFLRNSHLGFTGFELVNLLRWVDSSGFPFTYDSASRYVFAPPNRDAGAAKPKAATNSGVRPVAPGNMRMNAPSSPTTLRTNRPVVAPRPATPPIPNPAAAPKPKQP